MTRDEAMQVYKLRSEKFKTTQSGQWKANFTIWTLLALAIVSKGEMKLILQCWSEILVALLLIIAHFCYCLKIQWSLDSDKAVLNDITEKLYNAGIYSMNIKVEPGKKPQKKDGTDISKYEWFMTAAWQWIIIQVIITISLAMIFIFMQLPSLSTHQCLPLECN